MQRGTESLRRRSARRASTASGLLLAMLLAVAMLPDIAQAATPNYVETWDSGVAGWQRSQTSISLSNPSNYLRISFQSSMELPGLCEAYADATGSGGAFTGNYSNDGVRSVSFSMRSDDVMPSTMYLAFYSAGSGRTWHLKIQEPPVGSWRDYTIPLNYNVLIDGEPRHWSIFGGSSKALFENDLQDVTWIGISLVRATSVAQDYDLDDFTVSTNSIPDPSTVDSDGDKMYDWAEAIAGTDPNDSNSVLRIEIYRIQAQPQQISLEWDSITGRVYDVYISTNLIRSPFTPFWVGITSTPPRNTYSQTSAIDGAEGPYYFRLKVEESP